MNNQSPEELKEIMRRWSNGEPRQWADSDNPIVWRDCAPEDIAWNTELDIYRIKPALRRVPLTPEDFKGGTIWIRRDSSELPVMVTGLTDKYLLYCTHTGVFGDISYGALVAASYEWSNDRATWYPCWRR